jgi:anti-sigma regulatory factor (Ser/Thr protein kinase)
MYAQVALKLTGPMDHLRLVWQAGEALLDSVVFEEDAEGTRYNVLIALQEMVTNVLRHGYAFDETKPIEVAFEIRDDVLQIVLRDQGPPFDPLQHEREERRQGMPTEGGGFGIHILRMVMDKVEYVRDGGWNSLRMSKCLRVPART